MGSYSSAKIPVVDFSKENLNPGSSSWSATCKDVLLALEEFGCFIAVYDKVPSELQNKLFSALEELFNLPTETKMQNAHNKPYHGYVGQHSRLPLHESIGIDNATTLEGIQSFANLMWPAGNDHFCEITREFSKIALELDHLVTKMIFESYGVGKYYDSHLEPMSYLLRVLKHKAPKVKEPNLGFARHTDKSFITVLYQNQVKGLEVETKDGEWISLELSPSSFAVIAGDALVAWSNGRLHSPYHKVMMSGNEERYSLGLFQFSSGMIQIPEELGDDEHPLQFKSFDHLGLLRFFHTEEGQKSKSLIKSYCGIQPKKV
ncbi:hypothetical protein AAG906_014770 [Vitis piasezkii]